jgi:hypothetical protein
MNPLQENSPVTADSWVIRRAAHARVRNAPGAPRGHMPCCFPGDTARPFEEDAMIATRGRIEHVLMRIQSSFLEQPHLALTLPAAVKRFGVDEVTCAGVLAALADARVLIERGGVYRRRFPGPSARRAA